MSRMSEKRIFPAGIPNFTKGWIWKQMSALVLVVGLLVMAGNVQANTETPAAHEMAAHETTVHETAAPALVSADGLLPLPVEVAKPRTNEECIKCHKEQHLTSGRLDGSQAVLHIEFKEFKKTLHGKKLECIDCHEDAAAARHCRSGFQKVNCLACHSNIKGLFPYGAHERLQKKKIRIPKRKMVGDSFYQSKHGQALLAGKKNAPKCYNCHTRHYVYGAKSELSTVNRANLTETCGACHKERQITTIMEHLATFRLEAHRKGDLSYDYDRGNCIDCHQGEAVHGKKINDAPCARCHDIKVREAGLAFGLFHLYPNYEHQYSVWMMRNFYGIVVSVIILLLLLWGLYVGLRKTGRFYQDQEDK